MSVPTLYCDNLEVSMDVGPDISDVTDRLSLMVERAGIEDGTLHASVIGSTGSLTTIEYEPGVVEDLRRAITRLAPRDLAYEHEKAVRSGERGSGRATLQRGFFSAVGWMGIAALVAVTTLTAIPVAIWGRRPGQRLRRQHDSVQAFLNWL